MTKCVPPLKLGFRKCIRISSSDFVPNQGAIFVGFVRLCFFPVQTRARSTIKEK